MGLGIPGVGGCPGIDSPTDMEGQLYVCVEKLVVTCPSDWKQNKATKNNLVVSAFLGHSLDKQTQINL